MVVVREAPVPVIFADAVEFGFEDDDDAVAMAIVDVGGGVVTGSTEMTTIRFGAVLRVQTKFPGRQHHQISPSWHPTTSLPVPNSLEISVRVTFVVVEGGTCCCLAFVLCATIVPVVPDPDPGPNPEEEEGKGKLGSKKSFSGGHQTLKSSPFHRSPH